MQRMELFTSGVKVPKLGSLQDRMARGYLTHKLNREIAYAKLLAYTASNTEDEKVSREINNIWREYVNVSCFLGENVRAREMKMMQEYENIKDIKLAATCVGKGTDKKVVITGIPKELYK